MENPSILVIDADPKNLQILRDSLESSGFDVMTASDGMQALETIAQDPPDIILSEVSLPDMDGFQLLEKLKESPDSAAIPIMFLTNRREIQDRVRSLRGGVKDYMIKPLHVKEVIARIRMILRRLQRVQGREGGEVKKLAGRLEEHSVIDLIENFGVERKSGVLNVYNEHNRNGEIYFRDGAVVHASIGTLKAEKAVYQMLPWKSGHFIMTFKKVDVQDTISVSNLGLLLQGFKRMEERESLFHELPSPETTFVLTDRFKQILRQKELSPDVAKLITLIDGRRDIMKLIDESIYDDLKTLKKLVRLYQQGFIAPGKASDSAAPEIKIRGSVRDEADDSSAGEDDAASMFQNFIDSPASDSITFANGSSEYESEFEHDDFPPLPEETQVSGDTAARPEEQEEKTEERPHRPHDPSLPEIREEVNGNGIESKTESEPAEAAQEDAGDFLLDSPEMQALLTEDAPVSDAEQAEPGLEVFHTDPPAQLSAELTTDERSSVPEPMASREIAPDLDILEALAKFQEAGAEEDPAPPPVYGEATHQSASQLRPEPRNEPMAGSEPERDERAELPPAPSLDDAGDVQKSFVNPLSKETLKAKSSPNTFGKKLEKDTQFTFPLRSYGRPGDKKEPPATKPVAPAPRDDAPKRPVTIPEITPLQEQPPAAEQDISPPRERIYDIPPARQGLEPVEKESKAKEKPRAEFPDLDHLIPADEALRTPASPGRAFDGQSDAKITESLARLVGFAESTPGKIVILGRNPGGIHGFVAALSKGNSVIRLKAEAGSYLGIGEHDLADGSGAKIVGVSSDQQFTRLIDTLGAGFAGYVLLIEATTRENLDYFQYLYKALKTAYDKPFAVAVLKASREKNLAPETIRDMIQAEADDLIAYVDLTDQTSLTQFMSAFGQQDYLQRWLAD